MKKVVIWGHKLHTHTHSYIHNSYYKAFKRLGYDTYWFDNSDNTSGFDFENCIFLTEDQVHQNIPLNRSSFYILHHCRLDKYINFGCKFINLCNYVNDCRENKSFNYNTVGLEKLTYYSFYDRTNNALYQPWGTDLFPEEIDLNNLIRIDNNKDKVFYIGSIWSENIEFIKPFHLACEQNGKKLENHRFISDEEGRRLVNLSFISPDIRGQHHINVGYIPCRIFKNISYGTMPGTNSKYIADFFGEDILPFSTNTYDLFKTNVEYINSKEYSEKMKYLMKEVKENHTYITRVETILKFV